MKKSQNITTMNVVLGFFIMDIFLHKYNFLTKYIEGISETHIYTISLT